VTSTERILRKQPSGHWAIMRPGREPFELTSGDVFRVEVPGKQSLQLTRTVFRHKETIRGVVQLAGYYSIDGYVPRDGLRAAIESEG
jgi:hypothetical protein